MAGEYNAGSIEASLKLDRSQFTRELDEARRQADDFANNRYSATIDADTTHAREQIAALQAQMDALHGRDVHIGTSGSAASDASAIGHAASSATHDVDGLSNAWQKLDNHMKNASATSGILVTALAAFGPALAPIITATAGLGATLLSLGAAGGGAFAVFAGAAMGAVKAAQSHQKAVDDTGKSLKEAQAELARTTAGTAAYDEALKKVTEAEKAHNAALAALTPAERNFNDALTGVKDSYNKFVAATEKDTLTPLTTVLQGAATALPKLIPLVDALAPSFQRAADSLKGWLQGDGFDKFVGFLEKYGVPIVDNMIEAIRRFAGAGGELIYTFGPVASRLAAWISDIAGRLNQWADGGGFVRFKASFLQAWEQLKPILPVLWDMITKIWQALEMGSSNSVTLATVLAQIVAVMPPSLILALSYAWLAYKAAVAGWGAIAPGVHAIQSLLGTSMGASALATARATVATIAHTTASIAASVATRAWALATTLLSAALWTNPLTWIVIGIMAVVAAIVLIATKTTWFQTAWEYTWNAVKAVASAVWGFLRDNWQYLILILGPVGWIIDIATHWSTVWNGIKAVAATIWGWLQTAWQATTGAIISAWQAVESGLSAIWNALVNNVFSPIGNFFTGTIPGWAAFVRDAVVNAWNAIQNGIMTVWNWIYSNVIQPIGQFFTQTIPEWAQSLANFVRDRWTDIQNVVNGVFTFLRDNVFNPIGTFFTQTIPDWAQTLANFFRDRWNDIQNIATTVFNFLRDNIFNPIGQFFTQTIPGWAQDLANFIRDRWNDIQNNINTVYNWIKDNVFSPLGTFFTQTIPGWAQNLKDFVVQRWNDLKDGIKTVWDWIINNILNPIKDFFTVTVPGWFNTFKDKVKESFGLARDGIKEVWDKIQEIVKAPVTFIVETVYNKGIRGIWNNTAGKIGLPTLDEVHFAEGGQVPMNMGTPGKDSVRAMLMPGEHVLTTRDVQAMGGQDNVYKFRDQLHGHSTQRKRFADGGAVHYFADGGDVPAGSGGNGAPLSGPGAPTPIGPDGKPAPDAVKDPGPGLDILGDALNFLKDVTMTVIRAPVKAAMDAMVHTIPEDISPAAVGLNIPLLHGLGDIGKWPRHTAQAIEDKVLDFMGQKEKENQAAAGGNGYVPWADWQSGDETRVNWGGVTINRRTAAMMNHAVGVFKSAVQAMQGSYSTSVGASAGTHAGGGAIDVAPAKDELVGAMRASGFAAWHRTVAQGFSGDHVHGIAVGDHELSPEAQAQVTAFFAGRNGLADNGPDDYHAPGGPGGVIPTGAHLDIINKALAAAGVPPPGNLGDWQAGLNTLIERESGWNPSAVNNSDSNAAAGTPSIGLAQVIQPTFDAYKVPGYTNIYDGVSNVAAAIRYIVATYGNITNVQQANANLPPKGYELGTVHAEPGWARVGERGPEWVHFRGGEKVLPNGQTPSSGAGSGGSGFPSRIIVQIGQHEFEAVVTGYVDEGIDNFVNNTRQNR